RGEAGPAGRMAGDIATDLQVPPATLSFHLKEMVQAGLVESESQVRHVCYRATFDAMTSLIQNQTHNCSAGS
ncbi:winged helix-turn-helix domain-containing protein, partial [Stenotrophomonas maltophilia]|uniref:ArsR/SmtB family transcription factor n=1 Tax=Stenotrophomonas maltophilia TaxID=40324 RepID=UPI00313C2A5E